MSLPTSSNQAVEEWSDREKHQLLVALSKYGPNNLESIRTLIPFRSHTDIRIMIKRYERQASYDPNEKFDNDSPIDKWTQFMRKHTDYNQLVPIARALKYIALFEKRDEGNVNFRDCYEFLSNISEGIPPKRMDDLTSSIFYNTLSATAKGVKRERNDEAKKFLENFEVSSIDRNAKRTYQIKKKREAEEIDLTINPLKIPKNVLNSGMDPSEFV